MKGYAGKILRIDLTKGVVREEILSEDLAERFIGGSGLGAYLLAKELDPGIDPLSPDNMLLFMNGPLAGTRVPTSSRYQAIAKSPLTGIYGESDCGGAWGAELKMAGYDGVIINGKAPRPTYIWIEDSNVQLRSAEHLWGKDTYELEALLRAETDAKAVVTAIGPAGEKQALIAAIVSDGLDGRAAARCGLGAVMGSKNLKAIAVRGKTAPSVAKAESLKASVAALAPMMVEKAQFMHNYGTSGALATHEKLGNLPIKNWAGGEWPEGADKTNGIRLAESHLIGYYGCRGCIIRCGRTVKVMQGAEAGCPGGGPEYETAASLGSLCLNDDLDTVVLGNELCNRYGLDTISAGGAIAFAMEAYEKGIINGADTGGLPVTWGSQDAIITLIHSMGRQEGIGKILGQGVRRAARHFGQGSEEFALHVKGMEYAMHDPRAFNSVAVAYATSNRGACHLQAFTQALERAITLPELGYPELHERFDVEGTATFTAVAQDLMCLFDSLKLCKFVMFGGIKTNHLLDWFNDVTGASWTHARFIETGERIFNLKRLVNLRFGVTAQDDTLPVRSMTLKRGARPSGDNLPPLTEMLKEYYTHRGWDQNGRPTAAKLAQLQLEDIF